MMFPGCPSCASCADGYNGIAVHLEHHDVAMATVSRYPIADLASFRKRMGWSVPYVSSLGSEFNFDFGVAYTDAEMAHGPEHNLHTCWDHSGTPAKELAADETIPSPNDMPPPDAVGMSAFVVEDDVVYHTYSAYSRGMDALWGMYPVARSLAQGAQRDGPLVPTERRIRRLRRRSADMAKLTAEQRSNLPAREFGLPEKARTDAARKESGNYPIPDRGHAISAKRLVARKELLAAIGAWTGAACFVLAVLMSSSPRSASALLPSTRVPRTGTMPGTNMTGV